MRQVNQHIKRRGDGRTVDMSCPTSVMPWESRFKLNYTIIITLLDAPVEGRINVAVIGGVAIPSGVDPRVHTLDGRQQNT